MAGEMERPTTPGKRTGTLWNWRGPDRLSFPARPPVEMAGRRPKGARPRALGAKAHWFRERHL